MRNLPNIEKSGFCKGEYVGYGSGLVWEIKKANTSYGNWVAYPCSKAMVNAYYPIRQYGHTLADVSVKINNVDLVFIARVSEGVPV